MSGWAQDRDFGLLVRGIAASHGWADMERHMVRASPMLQSICKAAISPETLTTHPSFADTLAPFIQSLGADSIMDRVLADGSAVSMSYTTLQVNVALASIASYTVAEGAPKPVSALNFGGTVTHSKAASLIVVSEELLRAPAAPAMLEAEMRRSISAGVNAAFLDLVSAAGDTQAASGSSAIQITTDLKTALATIGTSARSRFYLAVSPSTLSQLALTVDTSGGAAFPDVLATGGSLAGISVMASDSLESPLRAILFDASRLAIGDGGVKLSQARHASATKEEFAPSDFSASATAAIQARACRASRLRRPGERHAEHSQSGSSGSGRRQAASSRLE